MRTRAKPAAPSAPASSKRHIQPWPRSGSDSSATEPTEAKTRPSWKSHSSISSWSPLHVRAEAVEVLEEAGLDGFEPRPLAAGPRVDPTQLEQVVGDRVEAERVDVAASLLPVRSLVRLERDELDRQTGARRLGDPVAGGVRALGGPAESMLELVVGQIALGLAVVTLCDEVEERLVLLVVGERLLDDLPAHRGPVLGRRERVAEPRTARPHAPEGTQLFAPVRVA